MTMNTAMKTKEDFLMCNFFFLAIFLSGCLFWWQRSHKRTKSPKSSLPTRAYVEW